MAGIVAVAVEVEVLVRVAVTVLVHAVADLGRAWVHRGIGVVTIGPTGYEVGVETIAVDVSPVRSVAILIDPVVGDLIGSNRQGLFPIAPLGITGDNRHTHFAKEENHGGACAIDTPF